ncbi:uncharacterized protein AMSG_02530 [Thecamonas trahens ATCC 50062]|uniref:Uncharacterized protein n=1 Tax=Thecamonas trahens ATCC 50062 TaxID=461836 RepID=A0A0L0D5M3_THETB|nr:hypothetical protein AMSG_02530 [Thecamonas trahens ATCC 50062]KNC47510.1 hypothetical protein AMSG_02530 [Thecamonas trahens ATCC 50062]|eukprot:XP_013759444.1 hypothetical protein AMSG_02530 [Thecamonas trahens ATCC 50062]
MSRKSWDAVEAYLLDAVAVLEAKVAPEVLARISKDRRGSSASTLSSSSSSGDFLSAENGGEAASPKVALAKRVLDLANAIEGQEIAQLYMLQLEQAQASYEAKLEGLTREIRAIEARAAADGVGASSGSGVAGPGSGGEAQALVAANAALEAKVRELDEAKREAEVWQPANLASSIGGYVWNATVKAFEVVSSATHHLTHNRRSRPGVYSALESEQMRTIHEYYKRYIAPTLPELLEVTGPDYASSATASPPKPRTFHLRSWQHKLGDGFLRPLARRHSRTSARTRSSVTPASPAPVIPTTRQTCSSPSSRPGWWLSSRSRRATRRPPSTRSVTVSNFSAISSTRRSSQLAPRRRSTSSLSSTTSSRSSQRRTPRLRPRPSNGPRSPSPFLPRRRRPRPMTMAVPLGAPRSRPREDLPCRRRPRASRLFCATRVRLPVGLSGK